MSALPYCIVEPDLQYGHSYFVRAPCVRAPYCGQPLTRNRFASRPRGAPLVRKAGMSSSPLNTKEDQRKILQDDDHMRDLERLELEVIGVTYPFATVGRVVGRIETAQPALWSVPNAVSYTHLTLPTNREV